MARRALGQRILAERLLDFEGFPALGALVLIRGHWPDSDIDDDSWTLPHKGTVGATVNEPPSPGPTVFPASEALVEPRR